MPQRMTSLGGGIFAEDSNAIKEGKLAEKGNFAKKGDFATKGDFAEDGVCHHNKGNDPSVARSRMPAQG